MYVYWAPRSIGAAPASAGSDVASAHRMPSSASAPSHRQRPRVLHFVFNGPPLTAARILEAHAAQVKRYYTPYPISDDAALDIATGVWDLSTVWESDYRRDRDRLRGCLRRQASGCPLAFAGAPPSAGAPVGGSSSPPRAGLNQPGGERVSLRACSSALRSSALTFASGFSW